MSDLSVDMSSPGLELVMKENDGGLGGPQCDERLPSDLELLGLVRGEADEPLEVNSLLCLSSSTTGGCSVVLVRPQGMVVFLNMDAVGSCWWGLSIRRVGPRCGLCLSWVTVLRLTASGC